jgi:Ca2+/Na+ antiporter
LKKKYLDISILVSAISIIITLLINNQIAKEYIKSSGKTRALFGLKELLQFSYQYYVLLAVIIALIFALLGVKENNHRIKKIIAIMFCLLAITIIFLRIWRLFV